MTQICRQKSKGVLEAAVLLALGLMTPTLQALPTINLTNAVYNGVASSTQGTINNSYGSVLFARDNTQPVGTGVFNPFLRLDVAGNNKDEQGYNTSASNVLDNKSPVNWTHDVLISSLQLDSTGQYYQFTLDINEPGVYPKALLSLDGLRLYSTSTPSQSAQKVTPATGDLAESPVVGGFVGTKLWDMDSGVDRSVLLDATVAGGPGSGIADMVMLVSKAVIDSHKGAGENYLVLWSRFGLEQAADTGLTLADAGFEEWAYSKSAAGGSSGGGSGGASGAVTSPGSSALSVLGLALLGFTFRARRQAQSTA